jgi:hypothetical protein
MGSNLYHLLRFIPATEAWEMPPALEALAEQIVRSGKLRVNADQERNFVRLGASNTDKTLTIRELSDPALLPATQAAVKRYVAPAEGIDGINRLLAQLYSDLKKARGVSADKEMKVARVLVQSAHPSVIQLLIASGTELFVSYSHNVADLMEVRQWETEGTASGLQATESSGTAVYVSAGGDPFFEGEHKTYTTDGFPALSRMVVIAGQELGHFSDLRRTRDGIVGRYSTDPMHSALRANPVARDGRLADMQQVALLHQRYQRAGLKLLRRAEQGVAFYHKRLRYSPPWCFYQLFRLVTWGRFVTRCKSAGIFLTTRTYPYHRHGEAIELFLADMAFNLAPDADVYRNADPLVEEAIAVIEAVARVPQQVHKWGHFGVSLAWPNLYRFYYATIIPGCMGLLERPLTTQNLPVYQLVMAKLRRHLKRRPGYYPERPKSSKNP